MPMVTFIEHDGTARRIDAPNQRSLMQIAVDNGVPGILGDCGGSCSCATCHGYIGSEWAPHLPPISETEAFMLEGVVRTDRDRRVPGRIPADLQVVEGVGTGDVERTRLRRVASDVVRIRALLREGHHAQAGFLDLGEVARSPQLV